MRTRTTYRGYTIDRTGAGAEVWKQYNGHWYWLYTYPTAEEARTAIDNHLDRTKED